MAETAFGVTYDGPALADGRMPVRDLAPALLALGDLLADASKSLYPDRDPVALNIRATAEGSFEVQLILEAAGAWDQMIDLLSSDTADALANLLEYVAGATGLFWAIKRLRNRQVKSQEEVGPGEVRLTLDDETTIEIRAEVLDLYRNVHVRKKARSVVEPLARPGVERLDISRQEEVTVSIGSPDVPAYDLPEDVVIPLLDRVDEMVVAIASVAFIEGNKWRLSDGERTFFAAIEDIDFLDRVEKGYESFRKGDMLRCRMRIVQSQGVEGLRTDYHVIEVIRHIPREIQMRLPGG